MKITVLGTGNVGCTLAADLSDKGHIISLVKTSKQKSEVFNLLKKTKQITLKEKDNIKKIKIHQVSNNLSLIKEADIIILTIQTNYHEKLIFKLNKFCRDGQIFIIVPGYLSTLYFIKHFSKKVFIVEAESSPIDCRLNNFGTSTVSFRNIRNPISVFPNLSNEVKLKLDLLKYNYTFLQSPIEAALHNPNLIVHTVGAFMSAPRIEKAKENYCMYKEVFTDSVWNILNALDKEKITILKKLNLNNCSYLEACKYRNSLDLKVNASQIFFNYANSPDVVTGPDRVDSRYLTEDVPQGLVLLESIGKFLKIKTPVCSSLIELSSVLLKKNFRKDGRTLEKLGKKNFKKII